jgi:radical SAM protein with 4Fe4S-binding SPASM domain
VTGRGATQETRSVKPQVAWLTVNRACNLRCSWCYARGTEYQKSQQMSLQTAERLMWMAEAIGVSSVNLIGGEPTLWEPLLRFNTLCRGVGLQTTLVTNGTRFGSDAYWEAYQQAPCTRIGLSIKAFDEKSFRATTGTGAFRQTRKGIERALASTGCAPSVVYGGTDPHELVKLARFAATCGARSFGISPSTPGFVNGQPDTASAMHPQVFLKHLIEHYDEINDLFAGNINISLKCPLCLVPVDFLKTLVERSQIITTCQLQHRSGLLFDPAGKLISCNGLHDFPIGDLDGEFADAPSLTRHLQSEQVVAFYDRMTAYASPKCAGCEMVRYCAGGCPLYYGVYDADDMVPGWSSPVRITIREKSHVCLS